MANEEQIKRLEKSVEDWNKWRQEYPEADIDLSEADLRGINLSQINLKNANLSHANFSDTNLSYADLRLSNCFQTNFQSACMRHTIFGDGLLNSSRKFTCFWQANLRQVNISRTRIKGVVISECSFEEAILVETVFDECQIRNTSFIRADLSYSDFSTSGEYLISVDFSESNLQHVDFSGRNYTKTLQQGFNANLSSCNFTKANLRKATFSNLELVRSNENVLFQETDLSEIDFSTFDLSGLSFLKCNLKNSVFCESDLRWSRLIECDLRKSTFWQTKIVSTDFQKSNFTGACLDDWHPNRFTNFDKVTAEYIYFRIGDKNGFRERRPSDPNRTFAPGDFERFIRQSLDTVDLIFGEGIDWNAFLQSFQGLQLDSEVGELSIAGIKKNRDGSFVVQVDVPADADKAVIEKDFWSRYQPILEAKDQQIKLLQGQLEFSQEQAERERRQHAADLITIVQTMADQQQKGDTYHINAKNIGVAGGHTTAESGSIIAGQYNAAEKLNLQQAAAEIQALLKQLETQYGSDTMSEKMTVATEVIKEIEQNQSLAQRVIAAFKAGGISALDSYLDTPVASFVISAIQNWYETR